MRLGCCKWLPLAAKGGRFSLYKHCKVFTHTKAHFRIFAREVLCHRTGRRTSRAPCSDAALSRGAWPRPHVRDSLRICDLGQYLYFMPPYTAKG